MASKKTDTNLVELKKTDDKTLQSILAEKRESIRLFRFGVSGSKVRDTKVARNMRKGIARILTELRMRAIQA